MRSELEAFLGSKSGGGGTGLVSPSGKSSVSSVISRCDIGPLSAQRPCSIVNVHRIWNTTVTVVKAQLVGWRGWVGLKPAQSPINFKRLNGRTPENAVYLYVSHLAWKWRSCLGQKHKCVIDSVLQVGFPLCTRRTLSKPPVVEGAPLYNAYANQSFVSS